MASRRSLLSMFILLTVSCGGHRSGCGANTTVADTAPSAGAAAPEAVPVTGSSNLGACANALRTCAAFPIGVAVNPSRLRAESAYRDLILRHFNSVVAENSMKMRPIHPEANRFDWTEADEIVRFATDHAIKVHGHALLSDKEWQLPPWATEFTGTRDEFLALLERHVKTIVGHYAGRVASWDVVNEAFVSEGEPATRSRRDKDGAVRAPQRPGELRHSIFFEKIGDRFMEFAFRWAHEADPSAKLFYNDYALETSPEKLRAVLAMVDDFRNRNPPVPIDGIGVQLHVRARHTPTPEQIAHVVEAITERNLLVRFSEVDVSLKALAQEAPPTAFTEDLAELQEKAYRDIALAYGRVPAPLRAGITVWGVDDAHSWLTSGKRALDHQPDWPLLFDAEFHPKKAFQGFAEGLLQISK